MTKNQEQRWQKAAAVIFGLWILISQLVFAFRHPWMTKTERLIYFPKALLFQQKDYKEARHQ